MNELSSTTIEQRGRPCAERRGDRGYARIRRRLGRGSSRSAPGGTRSHALRRALLAASALACLLALPAAEARLRPAPEKRVTIVGRVCQSRVEATRCEPGSSPGRRLVVRAPGGLEAVTDDDGRFHLSAVPGRSSAFGAGDESVTRLAHLPLQVDVSPLGPRAVAPEPVWVDLVPGSTAVVELVVHLPRATRAEAALAGADTGHVPAVQISERQLRYFVPLVLPPGHQALVEGRLLDAGVDGELMVPVLVGEREGASMVVDRAPDGRVRLLRQVVLRVPRSRGGDLFSSRPIEELAAIDLPPMGAPMAPGPLRASVLAPPGTLLRAGSSEEVLTGGEGAATLEMLVPADGRIELTVMPEGEASHEVEIRLPVDARAGDSRFIAADLRAGLTSEGAFGEGRLTAQLRRRFLGGLLVAGLDLGDDDVSRVLGGGSLLAARLPPAIERSPDAILHGGVLGDGSRSYDLNPAGLNAWGLWEGSAGRALFGSGRTGLVGAEVGRFDRPVVGPSLDLKGRAGPATLRAHGGAHLGGTGALEALPLQPARAELFGTGGSVYLLPHRQVAEGSERVWIEERDPRTGFAAARRLLVRGRDYEFDYIAGRLRTSMPVGRRSTPPAGRLAAESLGMERVIVVDYAFIPSPGLEVDAGHGALRLSAELAGVEVGLRGAAGWGGPAAGAPHRLAGIDLHAEPWPWLSVSASAAGSSGDPFDGAAAFQRSGDGGFTSLSPAPGTRVAAEEPDSGGASALRVRLGDERSSILGWWSDKSAGYADGAHPIEGPRRRFGGLASSRLLGARVSAMADHSEGPSPWYGQVESASTLTARLERRFGFVSLAAEGLHRRGSVIEAEDDALEGEASAAGAEIIFHAGEGVDLSLGRLQSLSHSGTHRAGRDPTFTSVGASLRSPYLGDLWLRAGLRSDLSPAATAGWTRDEGGRTTTYGGITLGEGGLIDGSGTTSVSGARSIHSETVSTFVESRVREEPLGHLVGRAVGMEIAPGRWRAAATYERGEMLHDLGTGVVREGLHGSLGLGLRRLDAGAFAEVVGTPARAADPDAEPGLEVLPLRTWNAGLLANLRLTDELSLGGSIARRAFAGRAGEELLGEGAESGEALVGAAWRPRGRGRLMPVVLLHYGLRLEGTSLGEDDPLEQPLQSELLRLGLVFGSLPGPEARLSATAARREIAAGPDAGINTRHLVVLGRLGWPVSWLEPALEGGFRTVRGAGVERDMEPTLRGELLAVLGPVRAGAGAVITGFAGSGIESQGGSADTSRVYLVLRGALQ